LPGWESVGSSIAWLPERPDHYAKVPGSGERAESLSFVAVGAVLLFAAFFYQRLSEQLEGRGGKATALAEPPEVANAAPARDPE
jgi:hypothetical protein